MTAMVCDVMAGHHHHARCVLKPLAASENLSQFYIFKFHDVTARALCRGGMSHPCQPVIGRMRKEWPIALVGRGLGLGVCRNVHGMRVSPPETVLVVAKLGRLQGGLLSTI